MLKKDYPQPLAHFTFMCYRYKRERLLERTFLRPNIMNWEDNMTTENYNERAEELKNKWKAQKDSAQIYKPGENAQSNNFIFDGIADPNEWYKQDIRPLFILKEAYNIELNEDEWNEVT